MSKESKKQKSKSNERTQFYAELPEHLTYEPRTEVKIGNRMVGKGHPTFVIAEVSANHRGKLSVAKRAIETAARSGADAVKFQHLIHDKIAADTPVSTPWQGKLAWKTLSQFYKPSEMPYEWTGELINHAKKHGIMFLSTPFDTDAVDVLAKHNVPAFKVASYEMTDDILLRYIARKKKPIIISTGMAYLEEVAHAVRVIQEAGNDKIVILHCVSIYPPKYDADMNLRAITTMQEAFKLPVGYSDHSAQNSFAATLGAVALGACVIERHVTDNQAGGSHDDPNSCSTEEVKRLMAEIRTLEGVLSGSGIKQPVCHVPHTLGEDEISDRWARRSLYAKRDIKAGEKITEKNTVTLRPWGGIKPSDAHLVFGRVARIAIKARAPITWDAVLG
jgi:N,N'-diacetyllegionaminate synthase